LQLPETCPNCTNTSEKVVGLLTKIIFNGKQAFSVSSIEQFEMGNVQFWYWAGGKISNECYRVSSNGLRTRGETKVSIIFETSSGTRGFKNGISNEKGKRSFPQLHKYCNRYYFKENLNFKVKT